MIVLEQLLYHYVKEKVVESCTSYRGIGLLSIPSKVYGRVVIEIVKEVIRCTVRQERTHGSFMEDRECVEQIFTIRSLVENP